MGIREKLNDNPGLGFAIAAVALLAVAFEVYHYMSGPSLPKADPASHDAADALAIAVTHAHHRQSARIKVAVK